MANPSNILVNQRMEKVVEPVRSRWTPKPEQILILESIFNSGMVNPPKDETVRIRKLLEKFGAVGDANVFYWFQNRRSRSRRRQRQIMQAAATNGGNSCEAGPSTSVGNSCEAGPSMSVGNGGGTDDLFAISRQMGGFDEFGGHTGGLPATNGLDLHYYTGLITVFINGVPSEVPRGPIDMGAMFGNDAMLVHSSGEIVPSTEYGILFQGLQMGESYFLVSRPSL